MPVALILGTDDKYVPDEAGRAFLDAIPSTDTEVFEFATGHVGIFVDPVSHEEGWPRFCDWLEGIEESGPPT